MGHKLTYSCIQYISLNENIVNTESNVKTLFNWLHIAQWKLKLPENGKHSFPSVLPAPEHKTNPKLCGNVITSCD